jgi:hypothetical protein
MTSTSCKKLKGSFEDGKMDAEVEVGPPEKMDYEQEAALEEPDGEEEDRLSPVDENQF